MGLGLAVWGISLLNTLFDDPTSMKAFADFIPEAVEARSIQTPQGPIVVPQRMFLGAGYIVVALLMWILVGMTSALLRAGTALLQPDVRDIVAKLRKEIFSSKNS